MADILDIPSWDMMMKKLLGLLLLSVSVFADDETSALLLAQERDRLIVGVKTDARLFGFKEPTTGEIKGFDVELAGAISRYLLGDEHKLVLKSVSAQTRFPMLQNAEVDILIATVSITEERKHLADFSDSYFEVGESILVDNHSKITHLNDLAHKKVIVVKGTHAVTVLPQQIPSVKLLQYDNYIGAIKALRKGEGVALVTGSGILMGIQKDNPDLHRVGGFFTFESYGIAVRKGDSVMLDAVNTALRKIRASGEYNTLYQKWFGDLVEKEYERFYQQKFGHLFK
jgi:putative glutamine transport system substrate-binding protein